MPVGVDDCVGDADVEGAELGSELVVGIPDTLGDEDGKDERFPDGILDILEGDADARTDG